MQCLLCILFRARLPGSFLSERKTPLLLLHLHGAQARTIAILFTRRGVCVQVSIALFIAVHCNTIYLTAIAAAAAASAELIILAYRRDID